MTGFLALPFNPLIGEQAEAARGALLWVLLAPSSVQVMRDRELRVTFQLRAKKVQPFSGNFVTDILMHCLNMMVLTIF